MRVEVDVRPHIYIYIYVSEISIGKVEGRSGGPCRMSGIGMGKWRGGLVGLAA